MNRTVIFALFTSVVACAGGILLDAELGVAEAQTFPRTLGCPSQLPVSDSYEVSFSNSSPVSARSTTTLYYPPVDGVSVNGVFRGEATVMTYHAGRRCTYEMPVTINATVSDYASDPSPYPTVNGKLQAAHLVEQLRNCADRIDGLNHSEGVSNVLFHINRHSGEVFTISTDSMGDTTIKIELDNTRVNSLGC